VARIDSIGTPTDERPPFPSIQGEHFANTSAGDRARLGMKVRDFIDQP
jgi:hypothetical protein